MTESSISDDPAERAEPGLSDSPQNVRVVTRDGKQHPIELRLLGTDDAGFSVWAAIPGRMVQFEDVAGVTADAIPKRTRIVLGFCGCGRCGR